MLVLLLLLEFAGALLLSQYDFLGVYTWKIFLFRVEHAAAVCSIRAGVEHEAGLSKGFLFAVYLDLFRTRAEQVIA